MKRLYRACIPIAAILAHPGLVQAQGCAMCKSSIAAQADNVVQSLGLGILVLLVPPVLIVSSILLYAFRRSG